MFKTTQTYTFFHTRYNSVYIYLNKFIKSAVMFIKQTYTKFTIIKTFIKINTRM